MTRQVADWIDSYVDLTDNTEPPELYRRWVAISVVAAALQRKCRLRWGSLTFFPNMYIILVGPPGKARKGTAMKVGRQFLEDLGIKMAAESITREALVRELQECNNSVLNPTEGTMETHSSLTIYSEELVVFLGHQNYQLMADLTDWYDCASQWVYRTKGSGTDNIIGVFVNLIGATTPDLIKTALPADAIGGGLTSRMIFVFEPRKGKIIPYPEWHPEQEVLRKKLLDDLERIHMLKGDFTASKAFIEMWKTWYTAQEDNPPFDDPRLAGFIERRPAHILKMCIGLSAAQGNSMVLQPHDLEKAIALLGRTELKMPQAFSGVGKNQHADTLNRIWLDLGYRKEMYMSEIVGKYCADADERTLEAIIRTLEKMEVVKLVLDNKKVKVIYLDSGVNSTTSMGKAVHAQSEGK